MILAMILVMILTMFLGLNARMFEWCMFYEIGNNWINFPGNSP